MWACDHTAVVVMWLCMWSRIHSCCGLHHITLLCDFMCVCDHTPVVWCDVYAITYTPVVVCITSHPYCGMHHITLLSWAAYHTPPLVRCDVCMWSHSCCVMCVSDDMQSCCSHITSHENSLPLLLDTFQLTIWLFKVRCLNMNVPFFYTNEEICYYLAYEFLHMLLYLNTYAI